jgi:transcriptional regulator with XRE-family HTH domain
MSFANIMRPRICDRALAVNAFAHNLVARPSRHDNALMHKRKTKRETPLAKLMAAYNNGAGISDNALAKLTGLSQPTVSRQAAGGVTNAKSHVVNKLADFFGVSAAVLRGEEPIKATERAGQPYADLTPLAMDIARRWMALSPDRQEWFRDLIFTIHFFEERFPALKKGRPKGESYTNFERAAERDIRQLKLELDP